MIKRRNPEFGEAMQMHHHINGLRPPRKSCRASPTASATRSSEIATRLVGCLNHIIQTFDCRESPNSFSQAVALLESLPLPMADHDLAKHRLENAQRYADSQEAGAAIYELRIMLAKIRSWF